MDEHVKEMDKMELLRSYSALYRMETIHPRERKRYEYETETLLDALSERGVSQDVAEELIDHDIV